MSEGVQIHSDKRLIHKKQGVHHNFDVSVIISLCDKYNSFCRSLMHNVSYFQRNGIEVILVVRRLDKECVLDLIKTYPFVNWQLIETDTENVVSGLNIGWKHATKKYIFHIEPEVEFLSDVMLQMRRAIEFYPMHYIRPLYPPEGETTFGGSQLGGFLVERTHLQQINGFDETFTHQNQAYHNACARLDMLGIRKLVLPEVQLSPTPARVCNSCPEQDNTSYRPALTTRLRVKPAMTISEITANQRNIYYPYIATLSDNGKSDYFTQTLYDWQNNRYAKELCITHLQQFVDYELRDEQVFDQKFKKILLCQAHNEEVFLPGFLEDMAKYFDGIILLDDASTDNTWKLAQHDKLLLKVKKKRECYNDIQNRNILLDFASFFQAEWFSFMDIDERLDERFADFSSFENDTNVHIATYRFIHLWNDEETYKGDIPGSKNGIRVISKLFRPIGRAQIYTNRKLHFAQVPYHTNKHKSQILIKDYGVMNEADRKMKYERYIQEDKQNDMSCGYGYMLNNDNLMKVSEIK